jgi:hypothetical protein
MLWVIFCRLRWSAGGSIFARLRPKLQTSRHRSLLASNNISWLFASLGLLAYFTLRGVVATGGPAGAGNRQKSLDGQSPVGASFISRPACTSIFRTSVNKP